MITFSTFQFFALSYFFELIGVAVGLYCGWSYFKVMASKNAYKPAVLQQHDPGLPDYSYTFKAVDARSEAEKARQTIDCRGQE